MDPHFDFVENEREHFSVVRWPVSVVAKHRCIRWRMVVVSCVVRVRVTIPAAFPLGVLVDLAVVNLTIVVRVPAHEESGFFDVGWIVGIRELYSKYEMAFSVRDRRVCNLSCGFETLSKVLEDLAIYRCRAPPITGWRNHLTRCLLPVSCSRVSLTSTFVELALMSCRRPVSEVTVHVVDCFMFVALRGSDRINVSRAIGVVPLFVLVDAVGEFSNSRLYLLT
nr:hypothetical protein [Halorubrum sp. BV1]